MSSYEQIYDGEGFLIPAGKKWKLACCDCGLVHEIALVASKNRRQIGVAMRRDNRATAATTTTRQETQVLIQSDHKITKSLFNASIAGDGEAGVMPKPNEILE